ncbi:MAG TPA: DNA polymerase III subunit alpha [Bacteroidetes bacterium]|nr:DNA polymerase III subunit alpha [Bacteroidota bacterium]
MPDFSHLHVHTQYSLLDGAASIDALIKKAKDDNQQACAITDHGNMYGVFQFVSSANKNNITPVIGCEFYLCADRLDRSDNKRFHQLLLAKNEIGYKNLMKLCSLGFTEGFYHKPRIDKKLLLQYKEGIIASTCCLAGIVPRTILQKGEAEGEAEFKWWLENFGEDYYIELQRHGINDQDKVNELLLKWSKKFSTKMIATNDSHYVNESDSEAHDILLCLQTGKDFNDPNRMRFENNQFFFKTKEEMLKVFSDIPEAIDNTMEVVSKVSKMKLDRDILLPAYSVPEKFPDQMSYLEHLTYEGAKRKFGEVTDIVRSRLEYELKVIRDMKFAGYFLIVQDFISAAKKLGVAVGPGRGSAAGSAVAYSIDITNIDPIKYRLLFERFLNPERVSMPDMDIDFDDVGRQKVIDYVVDKYGKNQVAQIITFGSMMPKMAVKDVSRVLGVPLEEANRIAKMIPEIPGTTFARAYKENKELAELKEKSPNPLVQKTMRIAETLEGCSRHTGVHAAGIIIAPSDIREHIPVTRNKDSELLVTQYSGKFIEHAGMLKMDFLGLKTLSIIKDAVEMVEKNHGVKIDLDKIPLDDRKTLEVFQRGEMTGVFQFESTGMRSHLKNLKPSNIEDLIAMNALYRPGPMANIPEYIERKHGRKQVVYPHPMLKEILEPTFGIMIYQEQIMQVAQVMAGYTLGSADILRKAMGKKNKEVMEKNRTIFIEGARKNGVSEKEAGEIFTTMEKFAEYGFNRSHSVAYAVVAFHTTYLKAHYPAEFMASALTHNMSSVEEMQKFLSDCKRLGIKTLGPDINESEEVFSVKNGVVRFALSAVKGVGEAAVRAISEERKLNGYYKSIFDLVKRAGGKGVNKKMLEALIYSGAFDSFNSVHRAQYFATPQGEKINMLEKILKLASGTSNSKKSSGGLFGNTEHDAPKDPEFPSVAPLNQFEKLHKEKEVTGIFLSGHPLDDYRLEIETYRTCPINQIENYKERDIAIIGLISEVNHRISKNGNPWGTFKIEDFDSETTLSIFGKTYLETKKYFETPGLMVMVRGTYKLRYGSVDQFEFYVKHIDLLSDLRQRVKKLVMKVELEKVNHDFIEKFKVIQLNYKGNTPLFLQINDVEDQLNLSMTNQQLYVSYDDNFLNYINELDGVELGLN